VDKLIVRGLGGIDGEYTCDLAGMLSMGHPETLTNREGHRIKTMTGLRAGELEDALNQGDNDLLIALGAIVLARHGKRFEEDSLWDAPMGSGLDWKIGETEETEPVDPPLPLATDEPGRNGGVSSNPISGHQENDPNGIGSPSSGTPISAPDSHPETSVT
jgi:hypothetical protein